MNLAGSAHALIVGSVLFAACASTPAPNTDGADKTSTAASATTSESSASGAATTATAVATTAPAPPTPEEIAAGRKVFEKACGGCHDKEHHTYAFVRTLDDVKYTEAQLRTKIRRDPGPPGDSPQMPAIKTDVLPDGDVPALVAYLRSIRAVAP